MAFSATELNNIAASALDFYVKGDAFQQSIQEKPLLNALVRKQKTFPGGKGNISIPVTFSVTTALQGFAHNDTVTYGNPANTVQAAYPWKMLHAGIQVTHDELLRDGISVVDTNGEKTSNHSERELTALTGLLDNKLADMTEGWARSFNSMLWKDGTQDAKEVPGIQLLIAAAPATGTVGGIDRATQTLWRNRALTGLSKITASASAQTLSKTLRTEVRQLRRYGGKPNLVLCGSAFLEALELEVQEKGIYTQTGFVNSGKTDIGLPSISMNGVGQFIYDPTLDDLSKSKFCYFIDTQNVNLYVIDGEDRKTHSPARPADQYVLYRGMTWAGGLAAKQLNGCGVYEVA